MSGEDKELEDLNAADFADMGSLADFVDIEDLENLEGIEEFKSDEQSEDAPMPAEEVSEEIPMSVEKEVSEEIPMPVEEEVSEEIPMSVAEASEEIPAPIDDGGTEEISQPAGDSATINTSELLDNINLYSDDVSGGDSAETAALMNDGKSESSTDDQALNMMLDGLLDDLDMTGSLQQETASKDELVEDQDAEAADIFDMLGADSESQDVSIDDLLDIAAPEEHPEEEPTDQKGLFQRVFGNVINDEIAEEERKAQEEEEQKAAEKAELAEQKKAEKEQTDGKDSETMGNTARLKIESIKNRERTGTQFVAVRFGNVLGSNGSVIPLFKKQIEAGGPVTVTHPDIIRYFMTIPEAVSLVLQAGTFAWGGEIFVLDMGEPVKIDTLARNLIKLSGYEPDVDIKIEYSGLRPGEKLFEEKLMAEEGIMRTDNELIHIGKPIPFDTEVFFEQLKKLADTCYNNSDHIVELVEQIVTTFHPVGEHPTGEENKKRQE